MTNRRGYTITDFVTFLQKKAVIPVKIKRSEIAEPGSPDTWHSTYHCFIIVPLLGKIIGSGILCLN